MATKVYVNYIRKADLTGVDEIRRIHLSADKFIRIYVDDTTHGALSPKQFDFGNAVETPESVEVPGGYSELVYRYQVDADGTLHVWIVCAVPTNTNMPVPDYEVTTHSGAATIFLATGETDAFVGGGSAPSWIPGALTTGQKKTRAISAIKSWRAQKKSWLLEAPEYADLVPNIVTHLGYWLRSADYVIKLMYDQGVATTLDWLIVEAIVKEAIKGPRTLDPDGDGAYNVEFFQRLKVAATGFPTGPTFGALWVRTWDLSSVGNVDRVADFTADVINTHGNGGTNPLTDPPDRTYHNIPAAYNSTADYWSS